MLRWSLNTTEESKLPLTINCWPEPEGGGQMNVNMEYELVSDGEAGFLGAVFFVWCREVLGGVDYLDVAEMLDDTVLECLPMVGICGLL